MDINPAKLSYIPTAGVKRFHEAQLVHAAEQSLESYGRLVHEPRTFPIEITPWPAQGWRPVDKNTSRAASPKASSNRGCGGRSAHWTRSELSLLSAPSRP